MQFSMRDNGRQVTADEIRKMYGTREQPKAATEFKKQISASDLYSITHGLGKNKLRKAASPAKQIRKAVRPENIGMRANGISDASLTLIKIAHRNGEAYDPDMMTKLAMPPNSMNGQNDQRTANDGARLAHDSVDDEMTDGSTKPTQTGVQTITFVGGNANMKAAVDAIKQDMARGAKPYMA